MGQTIYQVDSFTKSRRDAPGAEPWGGIAALSADSNTTDNFYQ